MKKNRTKIIFAALLILLSVSTLAIDAIAEDWGDDQTLCVVSDENGKKLFTFCGTLHEGDEYISRDNILYRIAAVQGEHATAERIGEETMPDVSWLDTGSAQAVFSIAGDGEAAAAASQSMGNQKLIAMYVTHSDESYIPSDGTESINGQGGIYDVAREFRDALQAQGVDVILDESTHLPHDAGAYRRSRQTAERLLQKRPDAIIDIHRDGIPDESEYTCSINGEAASQVRLLVGRGNQNSDVNREFAKEIKAVADRQYPGLIKDIFIGKGTYNQDLSPNAILLEFGTHTISKERVLNSTDMMAKVVSTSLYGDESGSAKGAAAQTGAAGSGGKGSMKGILIMIAMVVIGALVFAFTQTGSGKAAGNKLGRNLSEMTGGLLGRKKKHDA